MQTASDTERSQYKNVWVIAEQREGELKPVTFELIGAARELAAKRGSQVWCVVMGAGVGGMAAECVAQGADVVLVADRPQLKHFVDQAYASALVELIRQHKPEIVLCAATAHGRALIPRVAVEVEAGLTADCTGLDIDPATGNLLQTRPAFGGNIIATIKTMNHRPQMATVRPRVMNALPRDAARQGRVLPAELPAAWDAAASQAAARAAVLQMVSDTRQAVKLADARFIVAGGRGAKGKDGFRLLQEFADMVGGAVGASRAAVDAGWIDYAHQVGQTGTTVQPKVYMACGISGQIQHLVGMQSSDVIIAINKDANSPIMQLADYAVVGDMFDVLPTMMAELRRV